MEEIKQILSMLLVLVYLLGRGMLLWIVANFIGRKLRFAEHFLSFLSLFRRR